MIFLSISTIAVTILGDFSDKNCTIQHPSLIILELPFPETITLPQLQSLKDQHQEGGFPFEVFNSLLIASCHAFASSRLLIPPFFPHQLALSQHLFLLSSSRESMITHPFLLSNSLNIYHSP